MPRPYTPDDTSWVNPIAGKTKETQSHEKFILSVGYFALSTPGDCILLGTKVFSPQVPRGILQVLADWPRPLDKSRFAPDR